MTLSDYANEIKQAVSMADVCERYGIHLDRAGFGRCPFHNERTASFKAYPGTGGYSCFGCHASGDVIDFVMRYFDLPFKGAIARLNEDFGLGFDLHAPLSPEDFTRIRKHKLDAEAAAAFERWRWQTVDQLNDCFRLAHLACKSVSPERWSEPMAEAVKQQPLTEYYSDILVGGSADEQMAVFRRRKEVRELCGRILRPLQMRCEQA